MKNKISACLVIHNEEKVLGRCLDSIKDVVHEILVVHDGMCNDKSIDIAKSYGAKIFFKDSVGVCDPHLPFLYEKASGEWILQIDADEYLAENTQAEISKLVRSKKYDGYDFSWPYFDGERYITRGPFSKTRKPTLYRRSKMFFIGIVHENLRTYGKTKVSSDLRLEHKPNYDNFTFKVFRTKWLRWIKLRARQIGNLSEVSMFNVGDKESNPALKNYRFVLRHPFISWISKSIKFSLIYLTRGILTAGSKSWKIAFFEQLYILLLHYHVWIYRKI